MTDQIALTPEVIMDLYLAERMRCVQDLRRMAGEADRTPIGISFEGINRVDAAAILRAAARELERTRPGPKETK